MINEIYCETHNDVATVSICRVCGKPVCGDCAVTHEGIVLCNDKDHLRIYDSCEMILATPSMFEMDLIVRNLAHNGIDGKWFDPHMFNVDVLCRLFVAKEQSEQAHTIVQELDLIDFTIKGSNGK